MDISRLLPNAEYQAAVNSNSPSAINPFMTASAVLADYIPRTGTAPGAPVSGDIIMEDTLFPSFPPRIRNETGGSYMQFYQTNYFAFTGQATNPGTLTGFAYSMFDGFDITAFYPVGRPIKVKGTQNGSNDGVHVITAAHWDGVTNWFQWAGMTTEVAAPFGDFAFDFEGAIFSATVPDVLGTKEASSYVDPTGAFFTMNKGTYGTPGYLNGVIAIIDNFAGDYGGFFTYDSYPIIVGGQDYTIRQGVVSSVVGPGRQANVKTNYATYTENIAFNRTSGGTETILRADKTTNNDRDVVIQDRNGTLSFIDQIGGQDVNTLVTSPTITEDGYVLAWNQTNGEYELVAGGGGSNIYNTDGTVGTFRSVELTDIISFTNTSAEPIVQFGHFGGSQFFQIGSNIPTVAVQIDAYVGTSDTSFNSGTGNGLKIQANTGSIQTYSQNLGSPTGTLNMQGNNVVWTMPANKTGTVALTSDITAPTSSGIYAGSGSLQSGFTTVTMGIFDTLQFLKSGGSGTIVSVSDGTDSSFLGGKIVGVSDNTNSKNLQLDSAINGISFIDGNIGGGTQNIIFQEPTSLITHNLTLPVDVSGTIALTSDITGTNSGTNTGDQDSGTTFTISNDNTIRTINANSINGATLRDLVCTLIRDLNTAGILTV